MADQPLVVTSAPHKQGDTFLYTADFSANTNLDITIADMKSQIRTRYRKLIADVTITEKAPKVFDFRVDDTVEWPIGNLYTDFLVVVGDPVNKSRSITIIIPVVWAVTVE